MMNSSTIRLGGFSFGSVQAKRKNSPVDCDLRAPFFSFSVPIDAGKSAHIVFVERAVELVLLVRRFAKIIPAIVQGITVAVVDKKLRKLSGYKRENNDAVVDGECWLSDTLKANHAMQAWRTWRSCARSGMFTIPTSPFSSGPVAAFPAQFARVRKILKHFAKKLHREFFTRRGDLLMLFNSHDASSSSVWLGGGTRSNVFRLRSF